MGGLGMPWEGGISCRAVVKKKTLSVGCGSVNLGIVLKIDSSRAFRTKPNFFMGKKEEIFGHMERIRFEEEL